MNEEQLIDILNKTRHERPQFKSIKNNLLNLFSVSNCPDLTDVWNLAEDLSRKEKITIYEMNDTWKALTEMMNEGKCTMADFGDY